MLDRINEIMEFICDRCHFMFVLSDQPQLDAYCAACMIEAQITAAVAAGRYQGFRLGIEAAGMKKAPGCEGAQPEALTI